MYEFWVMLEGASEHLCPPAIDMIDPLLISPGRRILVSVLIDTSVALGVSNYHRELIQFSSSLDGPTFIQIGIVSDMEFRTSWSYWGVF